MKKEEIRERKKGTTEQLISAWWLCSKLENSKSHYIIKVRKLKLT